MLRPDVGVKSLQHKFLMDMSQLAFNEIKSFFFRREVGPDVQLTLRVISLWFFTVIPHNCNLLQNRHAIGVFVTATAKTTGVYCSQDQAILYKRHKDKLGRAYGCTALRRSEVTSAEVYSLPPQDPKHVQHETCTPITNQTSTSIGVQV